MKNLSKLYSESLAEVLACGIKVGKITEVTVNTRAKSRFGQTRARYANGHTYFSINISSEILADSVPDKETKNTIIHEILHTVEGCFNHGKLWKNYAAIINNKYGYHVSRCGTYEEFGLEKPKEREYKYEIVCTSCGKVYRYKRWTKACENPAGYKCGVCGASSLRVRSISKNVQVLRAW